jgi:hypothetical protein
MKDLARHAFEKLGLSSNVKWLSVGLILAGSVVLLISHKRPTEDRWTPVDGPLPGPNVTVNLPFSVDSPGAYALEVCKPTSAASPTIPLPPLPPFSCDLSMTITNTTGWKLQKTLTTLHHTGRYVFGNLDYYESEPFRLTEKGDYILSIGRGENPSMPTEGMFSLVRKENPGEVGRTLGAGSIVGKFAIATGVFGMLFHLVTRVMYGEGRET